MNILDIIGPIMIGPSSSHTAGAVRLALLARSILGSTPKKANIFLHGSFASTYKGHGTDLALVAGLINLTPDNEQIVHSRELAADLGMEVYFNTIDLGQLAHPNSVLFELFDQDGKTVKVIGCSLGGGRVCITNIDGFAVELQGELPACLTVHLDKPGIISLVTSVLANQGVNIAQMKVFRRNKGGVATMVLETDQLISESVLQAVANLPNMQVVRRINNVI